MKPATFWKGVVACLVLAVGSYLLAREQQRIRNLYGDRPQRISVAQLAAHGWGSNIWVELTDADVGNTFVVQTRDGKISAAWAPVFAAGDDQRTIRVVLRCTRCRTDEDIHRDLANRAVIRGAVINPILLSPYTPYRALLAEKYPDRQLAPEVYEVDVNYDKPSPAWAEGFFTAAQVLLGGALLCAAGALLTGGDPPADPSKPVA